jgi:hypothetical protein
MTLRYETTMQDVDAWYRHYLKLPEVASRLRLQSLAAAMSSGAIVFVLMLALSKDVMAASIVGALIFLVVWGLMGAAIRGEALKRAKRAVAGDLTSPALGAHVLEITASEITETCPHHKLSTRWDAVEKLIESDTHLFVLLRGHSAVIIPAQAFSSQEARSVFTQEVRDHISAPSNVASNRTT